MGKEKELRCKNLDDVCLDCMDNISPKGIVDCKKCGVTALKKIHNKILNDRFKKEMENGKGK